MTKKTLPPPEPPQPLWMYKNDPENVVGHCVMGILIFVILVLVVIAIAEKTNEPEIARRTSWNGATVETVDGHEFIVSRYQMVHHPDCPKCKVQADGK